MNEREAIARLRQGDIGGLELLVRAYQPPALRAAWLITHDLSLAEDVVQSAFLRAYERIAQFDGERSFGPWFLRSVVNDALKVATRRQRELSLVVNDDDAEVSIEPLIDPTSTPEELVAAAETRDALRAALGRLSPAQRAAIVQRFYLGMSAHEMAASQQCSLAAIKWRLRAARVRLKLLLGPPLPAAADTTRPEVPG
jgi:RNA polymerase sigma-70 factor (ECF subfamily)